MESNSGLTLTQVAHFGRIFIKYGLIVLVVLMVGRTFFTAAYNYWQAVNPPPPPPPTVGFGPLPPLVFPAQNSDEKPKTYSLETPNGRFPNFGDRAKVFLMVKSAPSLLADERVKEIAANYGFVFEPSQLNTRTYRWTRSSPLQMTLEMDIQNYNFSITSNYLSKPELLNQGSLPPEGTAVTLVKSFVGSGRELPDDIATASGEVKFLKSAGTELVPAVSFSDADFLQVDIRRTPIDSKYPFYTPVGTKGIISAILSGAFKGEDQIVEIESHYQPADYTERHTYPIRSARSAWQLLQAGEGYIAHKGSGENAVIRSVSLGYYDSYEEQEYLQPIYVFEGDDGFLGYVPAVDPRWIQQNDASTQ